MPAKIKILYIIDLINNLSAGTENQISKIINGLDKSKFEVHLYCLMPSNWIIENGSNFFNCSISVKKCCRFRNPITYVNILRLISSIKDLKPDIVHTFFPISNIIGVLAARLAGVSCIISSRRDYGQWFSPLTLFFTKIANRSVTNIHANSYAVKEITEKTEGVEKTKIEVIHNGIDIIEFKKRLNSNNIDPRLELCISLKNKIVGSIANLRPMKHLDTLIMASAKVLSKRKDISFVFVGEGPCRKNLEELSVKLKINDSIYLVGSRKDIIPYLKIFDIAVNCSAQEGISNAIMEYMMAGVPCLVSDGGGNPELVEDEYNGKIFPLDNYELLANLILELIDDDEKKQAYIRRSKEKIEKDMSIERMVNNFEEYYFKLLNK